ncbi:MAG: bifunctional DNA-formamidopyrimidine glycosylase/DNA-(apurinic or apyrimidinic site) lyase [Candidatus Neomarinimicrobiota bacterium]|nr:bifunctional DNA-formamidopyrimidine glycosylase/DNA-(apurinic or apyrimidinic site) lyase [Candidatus Neomarinimicrobiota bacterium]
MPELPEVQTVVNGLKEDLVGDRITCITPIWEKVLSNFIPSDLFIKGRMTLIQDVTRRAKFIIIHFPSSILAIHLRMTGKLFFPVANQIPKHTTAVIKLDSRKKLIFHDTRKFGRIYLYNDLTPINERHGPEPLGKNFSVGWLHRALQQRKRNIKALLLDQSFLAGLGNIYVDESLWAAGIHPGSISNALPEARIRRLHEAVQAILNAAITARGTTIIDFSYLNGQSGHYTSQLRIFGRQGQPCITCGREIEKIKVAGRGTYVCSRCQKKYTRGQSAPHQDRG